ncbi:hypothetical protein [Streptomyces syringium]
MTGTHPSLLQEVHGHIPALPGYGGVCTKEYMPLTVTADGV